MAVELRDHPDVDRAPQTMVVSGCGEHALRGAAICEDIHRTSGNMSGTEVQAGCFSHHGFPARLPVSLNFLRKSGHREQHLLPIPGSFAEGCAVQHQQPSACKEKFSWELVSGRIVPFRKRQIVRE